MTHRLKNRTKSKNKRIQVAVYLPREVTGKISKLRIQIVDKIEKRSEEIVKCWFIIIVFFFFFFFVVVFCFFFFVSFGCLAGWGWRPGYRAAGWGGVVGWGGWALSDREGRGAPPGGEEVWAKCEPLSGVPHRGHLGLGQGGGEPVAAFWLNTYLAE